MSWTSAELWQRFKKYYRAFPNVGLAIDLSRLGFPDDFFEKMEGKLKVAFERMEALEKGAIANPDEGRMVGHYWLRNPALAPSPEIRTSIECNIRAIKDFGSKIHQGEIRGAGGTFGHLLLIGIGGSALGPQFVADALGHPDRDKMQIHFFDNTDPDGMDRTLARLRPHLAQTLCVVVSKSGGTKETRNGMLEAEAAYAAAGLRFAPHAVAVTGVGSELDKLAAAGAWLKRFPMWDWVGGRTSEMSAVGLLPAVLQGISIDELLLGASECDELTRLPNVWDNPAGLLALGWFFAGRGTGAKDMVVLPYKDRLQLLPKYLQQLVMESLGKAHDLDGDDVHQGLTVYGNKGSTDQHAYVQQLRDGIDNFFVTFVEVLKDRSTPSMEVETDVTSGDYLFGFLQGTRAALSDRGRESITITVDDITPRSVGVLIALHERAVGLYASLINVNAYHQPGVQAGKKAAEAVLQLHRAILTCLSETPGKPMSVDEIAGSLPDGMGIGQHELVFKICEHLSANPDRGVMKSGGPSPLESRYQRL